MDNVRYFSHISGRKRAVVLKLFETGGSVQHLAHILFSVVLSFPMFFQ